jgi:hypothetical protein
MMKRQRKKSKGVQRERGGDEERQGEENQTAEIGGYIVHSFGSSP